MTWYTFQANFIELYQKLLSSKTTCWLLSQKRCRTTETSTKWIIFLTDTQKKNDEGNISLLIRWFAWQCRRKKWCCCRDEIITYTHSYISHSCMYITNTSIRAHFSPNKDFSFIWSHRHYKFLIYFCYCDILYSWAWNSISNHSLDQAQCNGSKQISLHKIRSRQRFVIYISQFL